MALFRNGDAPSGPVAEPEEDPSWPSVPKGEPLSPLYSLCLRDFVVRKRESNMVEIRY